LNLVAEVLHVFAEAIGGLAASSEKRTGGNEEKAKRDPFEE
jgi:hypothetical protein